MPAPRQLAVPRRHLPFALTLLRGSGQIPVLLSVLLEVRLRYLKTWGSTSIFSVGRKQVVEKHTAFEDTKTKMYSFGMVTSRNQAVIHSQFFSRA